MTTYFIGYTQARELLLAAESAGEQAAVDRLADFRGDERDMRIAVAIYERLGEGANAAELLRMVPSEFNARR